MLAPPRQQRACVDRSDRRLARVGRPTQIENFHQTALVPSPAEPVLEETTPHRMTNPYLLPPAVRRLFLTIVAALALVLNASAADETKKNFYK